MTCPQQPGFASDTWLVAMVDFGNVISESNEINNVDATNTT
jgi:hypothetical protein